MIMCALLLSLALPLQKSCCGDMKMFLSDPLFTAAHLAPAPFHLQSKAGKMVVFKTSGKPGSGFFVPASKGNTTAILVFHEWWGLNDYVKREAVKLHDELGAAILAVDLYDGKVTADPNEAPKLMGAMSQPRGVELIDGAISALKGGALGKAKAFGTIGWCFGGGWSHHAAIEGGKDVKACVIYYGMPSTDAADLARLKSPVLMFWGTQDGFINGKVVKGFEDAMKKAGKPLVTRSFNAVHAFANPSNPKYDKAATAESHKQTLAFFRKNLK